MINLKNDYYSDEVKNLIESIEKEIKTEKELELLEIRYKNLVKDVDELFKQIDENEGENDDDKNNNDNDNGKVGILI